MSKACPRLWHHVNNAWAPARNMVDVGSGSSAASSVVTAMQGLRLKSEDSQDIDSFFFFFKKSIHN